MGLGVLRSSLMRLFLLLFLLVSYTLARESFYRCIESALPSQCLEGVL